MTNPRSITEPERPWIENWSPDAHRVLLDAVRQRETARMALNVCSYIGARALGERSDIVGAPSRTQYRRILAELADEGITPPGGRSRVSVTPGAYPGSQGRPEESAEAAPAATPAPAARRGGAHTDARRPAPRMYESVKLAALPLAA